MESNSTTFFKHPFPWLKTNRLKLRPLDKSDTMEILFLRSDKEVNQFVKRTAPKNIADAEEFISKIQLDFIEGRNIYWVINFIQDTSMLGSICLWNFSSDRTKAEVGYDLKPNFQSKGIMSEALAEVLKFGFTQLKLKEISAFTQYNNASSIQLLKKNSFILKEYEFDPDNKDNYVYWIDKKRWSLAR